MKRILTPRTRILGAALMALALASCASSVPSDKPVWDKGIRFERTGIFVANGTPDRVFPLLCPVEEYRWIPDWRSVMHYSDSGVAEKNAVFETKELGILSVVWTCITYEPDKRIEYLLVTGTDVVRLSLTLEPKGQATEITWTMLFTVSSPAGKTLIPQGMSDANFQKMLNDRERQINAYLKDGTLLK